MSSVNKVILIGNLGKDPETRTFQNGGKVCNFSLATSETWRDKESGEKRERTEWHTVAVFHDKLADIASRYLRKGSKVYVEGKLQTRKWQDQSGNDRYSTEVVLQGFGASLVLLDGAHGGNSGQRDDRGGYDQSPASGAPAGGFNDEIPFAPECRG